MKEDKKIRTFRDIIAWQKSHELVLMIYKATVAFPNDEKFGLVSQMRRATVSVAANIVEGYSRKGKKEALNFYNYANASLEELKYFILITEDLNLSTSEVVFKLRALSNETGRILQAWINACRKNNLSG